MLWFWIAETTIVAGLMAIVALIVHYWSPRRPAFCHALWLLVLLKLMTPPWFRLPLPERVAAISESVRPLVAPPNPPTLSRAIAPASDNSAHLQASTIMGSAPESKSSASPTRRARAFTWRDAERGAIALGLAGALILLARQIAALVRLERAKRRGLPAPVWLSEQVERTAQTLGVRSPRVVVVVSNIGSPAIWCWGHPCLLIPANLVDALDAESWKMIITHELSHVKRRDHWVVWLELLAMALWWWNPLFWLVRRQLRIEADRACDAWVAATWPKERRAYADALLDICQIVHPEKTATSTAALALGNSSRILEKRLLMILERKPVFHRLSRRGFAVLAMAALAFAPAWSWGQSRREVQVVDGRIVLVPPSPNPEPTRPPAATADQEPAVIAARHDVERAKIRLEIADGEVRKAEAERDMKMSKSNRAKNLVSRLPDAVSPDELKGYEAEARAADADVDIKTKERKALALDLEIAEAAISKAIQEWKARVESEKTRQERYREAERIRKQMEPALNEQEKALREARKADEERIAQEFTPEVYRAKVGDQLAIEVLEALPGRPILGERPVRPDGTISLGWYGEVRVIGLTRRQIKEKVIARLRKFINDEALGLLAESLEHPGELIPVAPANSDRVFVEERYDRQAPAPNAQNLPPWRGADADANANAKGKPVSRLPATNVNMIAADDSPKSALTWEALNAEADFSFAEAKLEDLLEMIQQKSQSPQMPEGVIYYLDRIALEEGEFDREKTTFRLNLPKVSLKMGLGLALREMGLTFCIKSGVLVITSAAHVGDFVNHQFSSFPMTQVRPGFDANGAPTSGMNGGGKF